MNDRFSMPDKRNDRHYSDPTAYHAMKNIVNTEREIKRKADNLIGAMKQFADVAGFEIVGRIHLRHTDSEIEFR